MYRKILQPFYTIYVALSFIISIVTVLPFIALISTSGKPAARHAIHSIIKGWSYTWLWLIGMRVTNDGDPMPEGRYIIVANHISYMDTLVIFPAVNSYFRPLGKKEIVKIPFIGFIYKQIVILVDRSSAQSRAKSMKLMWRVLKHEGNIIIFPEGTFNETPAPLKDFYDGAFRLALTTGTDILPLILPDTSARWHFSGWWKLWPGRNRIKFLEPVSVAGMTVAEMPALKKLVYDKMEAELIRFAGEDENQAEEE